MLWVIFLISVGELDLLFDCECMLLSYSASAPPPIVIMDFFAMAGACRLQTGKVRISELDVPCRPSSLTEKRGSGSQMQLNDARGLHARLNSYPHFSDTAFCKCFGSSCTKSRIHGLG